MSSLRQAFVAAGANLGDRAATLRGAAARLRAQAGIAHLESSPLYETDPVGHVDQPAFLNAVLGLETALAPEALLALLQSLEAEFGRERTIRWGPRTLDLDLLAYEGETRDSPALQLPHPRMLEREFVTVPLRALLDRPRFRNDRWQRLRGQLQSLPASSAAVRAWPADYAGAVAYLLELKRRGVRPGLDRMQRFVAALEHPERAIPCIHIAGTNGKGSVAAMLEAMLRAAGWRTGLYTSPHLVRLGERIQVNRTPLAPAQIAELVHALQPAADEAEPSYFEFMTALAFRHFARVQCDIVIVEAGMGGRLDATNVVTPEVSVITSVGLDHMEFLGDTVAQIATEKAGIIKPGVPVIAGVLPLDADRVIRSFAAQHGCSLHSVTDAFGRDPARFPATNLPGRHQRMNAATATLVARALPSRWRLTPEIVATALERVVWPGRWQQLRVGTKHVILEAAHNVDGADALDTALAQLAADSNRAPVVVVGALGAGRARPLLATLCRHAREIHLAVPRQTRACTHEELESLAPETCRHRLRRASIAQLFPAPGHCAAGADGDTVVVTGSVYLIGEVLSRLEPDRGPLEDHLQDF